MTRVIVLGGLGHFGRTIVAELAKSGISATAASRRKAATLSCDAESASSLRSVLRAGDLVIDAAGPFHLRTMTLIETALDIGCDVVDINDNLGYAEQVISLEPQINAAGIRVVTSASTVSAISAAVIRESGIERPTRLNAFLLPATRRTANVGSALSFLRTVGRPIQIWRDGRLQFSTGWTEPRSFVMPSPMGRIRGRLYESADAVNLPREWPSLREVTMHVDANVKGSNALLSWAAASEPTRRILLATTRTGVRVARILGSNRGGVVYVIEDLHGHRSHFALLSDEQSYLVAVAPVVLSVLSIVLGDAASHGLRRPSQVVEPAELWPFLHSAGIPLARLG